MCTFVLISTLCFKISVHPLYLHSFPTRRSSDLARPDCHGPTCTMVDRSLVTSGKALACNRFLDTFGDNSRRSLPRLSRDPMYLCSRCRLVSSDEAGGQ